MKFTRLLTSAAVLAMTAGSVAAQAPIQGAPAASKSAAPTTIPATPDSTTATPAAAKVVANGDLIETARASGQFTTFLKAIDATNLTAVLKTNKNLTVFAPTDAAFAALPPGELDRLMANKPQLQKLLTYHVINARVDSTKIKGAKGPVATVAGPTLELDGSGPMLMANNADIIQPDVMANNGVLHVIDKVLTPGSAMAATATGSAASTTAGTPNPTAAATSGATAGPARN